MHPINTNVRSPRELFPPDARIIYIYIKYGYHVKPLIEIMGRDKAI